MIGALVVLNTSEAVSGVSSAELLDLYNGAMRARMKGCRTADVWLWCTPTGLVTAAGATPDAAREAAIVSALELGCEERTTVATLREELEHVVRGSPILLQVPRGRRGQATLDDLLSASTATSFPGLLQSCGVIGGAR